MDILKRLSTTEFVTLNKFEMKKINGGMHTHDGGGSCGGSDDDEHEDTIPPVVGTPEPPTE